MKHARGRKQEYALSLGLCLLIAYTSVFSVFLGAQDASGELPSGRLAFGDFIIQFGADSRFTLDGEGWPSLGGRWSVDGGEIELIAIPNPGGCPDPGRYRYRLERGLLRFEFVSDDCVPRRMILDQSFWREAGKPTVLPERQMVLSRGKSAGRLPEPVDPSGSWPSFRGPGASGVADGQGLPDRWNGETGENILWRTPIPGLAHSSPVVWGSRIFVTTAISSDSGATFRPGLFGEGDASDDRSYHRWVVYAIDKDSGDILWEQVAYAGPPIDKRHVKSTYASSTPATDGRLVVAWFGSQGVFAYDVEGRFLWKVDLGRIDVGAYDIPTYEWGPASSPIIWNGLVLLQCDTQTDSFLLALDAETGETVWKTQRDELPSWGSPTVGFTSEGPELVTNASNFIRGYDPRTGMELWKLGGSSKITAPTPVFSDDLFVVASGRAPEAPIYVVRAGARGDLSLPTGSTESRDIAWSRTQRGSYMPTPLVYRGLVYVLANNGILDAYDLETGEEIYRRRLEHLGSGFSASPVAADGKMYLAGEDGEIIVLATGPEPRPIATNAMGEALMATPALSGGTMYVRSADSLFAIGRSR